jgi:hypothetical protein
MRFSSVVVILAAAFVLVPACGGTGSPSIFNGNPDGGQTGNGNTDATMTGSMPMQMLGGDSGVHEGGTTTGCTSKTCAQQGFNCGMNTDGCGNIINCGSCASPQTCGGGGFSVCGTMTSSPDAGMTCTPKTCAQLGFDCGMNSDGCGSTLNCGTCAPPGFCGGGGFSTCGTMSGTDGGTVCTPKTCAMLNINCGPAGDGCGNMLACGTCMSPQTCGGGGPGVCGTSTPDGGTVCTPKTCLQLGFTCGPAGDGCGNMLACGTCQAPDTCGGGGTPSVCGNPTPCTGLCLNQVACDGGTTTTLTGQVVAGTQAPYGNPDPVPNVLVYVPNGTVQAFAPGVECSQCGADVTGSPLVQATTDYLGNFALTNVPVPPGGMVPIVIQLGRWRRQNLSFAVKACQTTTTGPIHMPRNKSEGDIPLTAVSTGNVDALECVVLKMGVDQAEFTQPTGTGRIQLYRGNGAKDGNNTPAETVLTQNPATLAEYDEVLFPCWGKDPRAGGGASGNVKTAAEQQNVINYTNAGGRIFATHYQYAWLYDDAPFQGTATWIGDIAWDSATAVIVQPASAEVTIFYQWMNALASSGATNGQFPVAQPRNDFSAITAAQSTLWMTATGAVTGPNGSGGGPSAFPLQYTFNTPVGQANQCGRVIFSDFHVAVVSGGGTTSGQNFPGECDMNPMNPQEKALEYLIWDLASCVPPPPTSTCTPRTCGQENIGCGPAGDGCGNLIQCGPCTPPATCGGGGVSGQCGDTDATACMGLTCAQQNIGCGPAGDGCGNLIQCGPCTPPATCGGGGVSGQCGQTGGCTPHTCAQQNISCGPAGDGCGNLIQCGQCVAPATCGGGGVPGQCGLTDGGACTPKTCAALGISCGPAGDGCGGLLSCGACVAPQTCGGGGTPGVCGGGTQ